MSEVKLKEIPQDVFSFLLKKQGEIKAQKKLGQFSLSKTVTTLIKEHPDFKEKK
jgi:hypothetical protein